MRAQNRAWLKQQGRGRVVQGGMFLLFVCTFMSSCVFDWPRPLVPTAGDTVSEQCLGSHTTPACRGIQVIGALGCRTIGVFGNQWNQCFRRQGGEGHDRGVCSKWLHVCKGHSGVSDPRYYYHKYMTY